MLSSLLLKYPQIDPVFFSIPIPFSDIAIDIRWYSLAYIAGLVLGWLYLGRLNKKHPLLSKVQLDSILTYCLLGVVLGGRLGFCLFYQPSYYLSNPQEILYIWQGGMSFHGGFLGVIAGLYLFARKYNISFFAIGDRLAVVSPIGLFFGRIANFINGELYGRATDVSWAFVFPNDLTQLPRHPSQLYEAGLEGLAILAVTYVLVTRFNALNKTKLLSGVFLIMYGLSRIIVECFREPDAFLGYFAGFITMGQILSLPMVLLGIYLIANAKHNKQT